MEEAKGARYFVQFYEEALEITYITKWQYEVLLQAKKWLNQSKIKYKQWNTKYDYSKEINIPCSLPSQE